MAPSARRDLRDSYSGVEPEPRRQRTDGDTVSMTPEQLARVAIEIGMRSASMGHVQPRHQDTHPGEQSAGNGAVSGAQGTRGSGAVFAAPAAPGDATTSRGSGSSSRTRASHRSVDVARVRARVTESLGTIQSFGLLKPEEQSYWIDKGLKLAACAPTEATQAVLAHKIVAGMALIRRYGKFQSPASSASTEARTMNARAWPVQQTVYDRTPGSGDAHGGGTQSRSRTLTLYGIEFTLHKDVMCTGELLQKMMTVMRPELTADENFEMHMQFQNVQRTIRDSGTEVSTVSTSDVHWVIRFLLDADRRDTL